jgi:C4-dicarboxylate-specific signal transduction histidine kinase
MGVSALRWVATKSRPRPLRRAVLILEAQQDRVRSLRDQILLSEQATAIGHVMQHFRHRLVNQTGAMAGWIEQLEDDLRRGRQELALEDLGHLKATVRATANSFGKAQGYVKRVEPQACRLTAVVADARTDLGSKLEGVAWDDLDIPADTSCWTDPVIVGLILYSLLENAADAQRGQADALIRLSARTWEDWVELRVEDKGTGISAANRDRLFTFGFTTKPDSLGSALAFARVRAAQLGAELRLASPQPQRGAAFELLLPANETSWARATAPVSS